MDTRPTFNTLLPLRVFGIATTPGEILPAGTELRFVRHGAVITDLLDVERDRIVGAFRDDLSSHELEVAEVGR